VPTATRRLEPTTVVRSFLDHLAVERGAATNTLNAYRRDLGRYLGYLDALEIESIADVETPMVSGFLAHLREGDADHPALAASSTARVLAAVRGLHRFALHDGLVATDVTRQVRTAAPPRRLPKAITVDDVEPSALAEELGIDGGVVRAMASHDRVRERLQQDVDAANAQFARIEQVKKFTVLEADLSQEAGELTPTMKVKRAVVEKRYADTFDELYKG